MKNAFKILYLSTKTDRMKRLLVHLHLYYKDQTDYFLEKLSHISGCRWTLYVTVLEKDIEIEKKFLQLNADVRFLTVDNAGYDILPFIKVIRTVCLYDFDYILKLHTKASRVPGVIINGQMFSGFSWRNELVDSLIGSRCRFRKIMRTLDSDPLIGLVCSDLLFADACEGLAGGEHMLESELARLGITSPLRRFCAGTMFIVRASACGYLQSGDISDGIFGEHTATGETGSMSHVYERILSMSVGNWGYKAYTVVTDPFRSVLMRLHGRGGKS